MPRIIHDQSHRAEQAFALRAELEKLELRREVIISCGLEVAEQARSEKGDSFICSIGDAGDVRAEFNALIMPNHEPLPEHDNIIKTTGLLNKFSPEYIAKINTENFSSMQKPCFSVFLGGRHVGGNVSLEDVREIAELLNKSAASALLSNSKRTEKGLLQELGGRLKIPFEIYDYNYDGIAANPYEAMLSACDVAITTADSARMMSEICSSGKAAYIYSPQNLHFSYAALRDKLSGQGYAHDLKGIDAEITPTKLLQEAKKVAAIIANQL